MAPTSTTPAEPSAAASGDPQPLADRLSDIARSLEHENSVEGTLQAIVDTAVTTVPGAGHASISAVHGKRAVITLASTSELPRRTDQAQYDTGAGPCLDSLYDRHAVRLDDVATETRWPEFVARAGALGMGSMLSLQLYVEGDDLGALNLLSEQPHSFDEESEQVALLFASHAAVAMAGAGEQEHLRWAICNRDLIGQAKGILMERFSCDADRAFLLLAHASQAANRKLTAVAEELVDSRRLPGPVPKPRP